MAIIAGAATRALRGMGRYGEGVGTGGLDRNAKTKRAWLPWSAADNDTVTPGNGGLPYGVVDLLWRPAADNDPCSIFWDASAQTGTFATDGSGPYIGWLEVHFVHTRT